MRILYVEDEKFLADAVIHLLNKANISTDWAADGELGLKLALKPNYDCIILDIMLPKISGIEILKTIRKKGIKTPVIMLSALSETDNKVHCFEYGADDYLTKPFKAVELIARVNALSRRPPLQNNNIYTFSDLSFDSDSRTLNNLPLTEKEAEILSVLIKNPDKIQKKEHLLAYVWGSTAISEDNYVEVYISYLRKKLKQLNSNTTIKTIRNLGYKLTLKNV